MNQEERDIRLLEYWQGELLSPEEVREVESWLGEKGENRRYFEDLQREFLRQRWVMRERRRFGLNVPTKCTEAPAPMWAAYRPNHSYTAQDLYQPETAALRIKPGPIKRRWNIRTA